MRTEGFKSALLFGASKKKVLSGHWETSPQNRHLGAVMVIVIVVAAIGVGSYFLLKGEESEPSSPPQPPSVMLTVTAENTSPTEITLTIEHTGGDDLAVDNLEIEASMSDGTITTFDFPGTGTFKMGDNVTATCSYGADPSGKLITVYIIHLPSQQKIFSSATVLVRLFEPYYLANPKSYRATYSVTITNISARMDTMEIWIPRPIEWDSQKEVEIEEVNPTPTRAYFDSVHQNGIYYWKFLNKPRRGANVTVSERFTFTAYDLVYDVDPNLVSQYDRSSQLYQTYTKSEDFIEADDPAIKATAQQIVGGETNPYKKARLIYDWVLDWMRYQLIEGLGGAKFAFERGYGECGDYAALFCALLRAVSVPARPVVGYWAESDKPCHVWAEFYLPGYGWVPADPSVGDAGDPDRYFAHLETNNRLIFSKGFNIRLSSYHTADLYQTFYWWYHGSTGGTRTDFNLKCLED